MKKLLSICFLSILLGLLSFSTQAQSNCYGFWMENLQPDVLSHVANPGDGNTTGTYALNHTLGHGFLINDSTQYLANVSQSAIGQTELYELHFCDCGQGKKVSLDWLLYKRNFQTGEWELVNDAMSNYADFSIYTLYPQINSMTGQCQSIKWLGGLVPNGFGCCTEQQTPSLLDQIQGVTGCNTPTNYPGALQSQYGTVPGSVVNVIGETTSSMGMTPLFTQGFDYFYADFLASTRTIVTINWKQVGDYKLVMNVRERIGGTDWTNATWGGNETAYIGGHQSCCGPVLISDTLHYPVLDSLIMEVCQGTHHVMGSPYTYDFGAEERSILDTTLLIGQLLNAGTDCEYIDIDTLRNVNYLVRMTPVVQVLNDHDTLCKCDDFTSADVLNLVQFDSTEIATFVTGDETVAYKYQWYHGCYDEELVPALDEDGDPMVDENGDPMGHWENGEKIFIESDFYLPDHVSYTDAQGVTHHWYYYGSQDPQITYEWTGNFYDDYYFYFIPKVWVPDMICSYEEGWFDADSYGPHWFAMDVNQETNDTSYMYIVRQVNTYNNYGDTVVCEGPADTLYVTFREVIAPELTDNAVLCYDDRDSNLTVIAIHDSVCANTTRWYRTYTEEAGLENVVFTGDTFVIDLAAYAPTVNIDTVVNFYAVSYDTETDCSSSIFTVYSIVYHQNPVLEATVTPEALICPASTAEMQVKINNDPLDVDPLYTYYWKGVDSADTHVGYDYNEVEIADNEAHYAPGYQSSYIPVNLWYYNTLSQQIYTADEVPAGMLSAISFHHDITQSYYVYDVDAHVKVYLSTTDKDAFETDSDWDLSPKTLVFDQDITFPNYEEWVNLDFDQMFEYDGSSNLLLTVVSELPYDEDYHSFYVSPVGDDMSLSIYNYDHNNPYTSVTEAPTIGNVHLLDVRNDVRFEIATPINTTEPYQDSIVVTDHEMTRTSTNAYLPFSAYWEHNYSQQLYTPAEVSDEMAATITELTFDYRGSQNITSKGSNVKIYLGHTSKDAFANANDMIPADSLELVYDGEFNCVKSTPKNIVLDTPFEFNGTSNLVVVVYDNSDGANGTSASPFVFGVSNRNKSAIRRYAFGVSDPESMGNKAICNYRNNITFTTRQIDPEYPHFVTDLHKLTAYKELVPTCDSAYVSTVYVVDANGCKSNVVTFNFTTGDTIAPVIVPATYSENVNTCDSATLAAYANQYAQETVANLDDFLKSLYPVNEETEVNDDEEFVNPNGVTDNCSLMTLTYSDVFSVVDSCNIQIVRTYTVMDSCHNASTFTHTFIGHDENAPVFAIDRPIRLIPDTAGDCKYNAPALPVLKEAIAPFVTDECTDAAFLMSNVQFFWENTGINPAGAEDIFVEHNHLTISAVMYDKCGNWSDTTVIFFLDRPDTMFIDDDEYTPVELCFGATTTLTFDPATIVDDQIAGPFTPYTYQWSEVNGREVTFSAPTAKTTTVNFNGGYGDYHFVMTVTNSNGCTAVSSEYFVHVRPELQVAIEPIVLNGAEEPYCPTYGNLTIKAIPTGEFDHIASYTWTGESVNEYSTFDTTWITIIPEWCDTTYTAHVAIVDDHNCTASASRTFEAASEGITIEPLDDITVEISDSCRLIVPDFRYRMTSDVVSDDCYTFGQIKYSDAFGEVEREDWYTQTPAAGYIFTTDSVLVTITVTDPCGADASTTFYVRKPGNYPTVAITPISDSGCYNTIMLDSVDYVAAGLYLGENPSFVWTVGNDTVGETAALTLPNDNWEPQNMDVTYTFNVVATNNENGCIATANVPLTVFYQGDSVSTRTWPNTVCTDGFMQGHFNGVVAVDTIYDDYVVTLTGIDVDYPTVIKINDVPSHQLTPYNTVFFDSLQDGRYHVTVQNLHGCIMEKDVEVVYNGSVVDTPLYTLHPVTVCKQPWDGEIVITPEAGYSYTVTYYPNTNNTVTGVNYHYSSLKAGYYRIVKKENATGCASAKIVQIVYDQPEIVLSIDSTPNTKCSSSFDGTLTLNTTGYHYWVTGKFSGSSVTTKQYPSSSTSSYPTTTISSPTQVTGMCDGAYTIRAYNPTTGCETTVVVSVPNGRVLPEFDAVSTPNNYCFNGTTTSSTYNGTIEVVNPQGTYSYRLSYDNTTSHFVTNNTGIFTNLWPYSVGSEYAGGTKTIARQYTVRATNTTNNCYTDTLIIINSDNYYPDVDTITTNPNTICDATIGYNGSATFDVTANIEGHLGVTPDSCEYVIKLHGAYYDSWKSSNGTINGYFAVRQNNVLVDSFCLPYQTKEFSTTIKLASNSEATLIYYNNRWGYERSFELINSNGDTVWSKTTSQMTANSTTYSLNETPNCYEPVEVIPTFNDYIKPFSVSLTPGTHTTTGVTDTLATVGGLKEDTYNYTVTSKFNCKVTGTVDIELDDIPALVLDSTPNHMCVPTFEKPGDGTIIVLAPTSESNPGHVYEYKFFDADSTEMNVPYELPMTHTKYWLAAGLYKVKAFEPATGCAVYDTIRVTDDLFTVNFTTTTTPSSYCSETSGDGTITVNATSTNPSPTFNYSLDGETWQASNVFTGLANKSYNIYVMDIETGCTHMDRDSLEYADCAPVITIYDSNNDTSNVYHYCFGVEGIKLFANADDTCGNEATFSYRWDAPCADPTLSNTSSIDVQTDHDVIAGCEYILTVTNNVTGCQYVRYAEVFVHPNPQLSVTINGNPASTTTFNTFCENDTLTLAVQNNSTYMEQLDVNSIQWTAGVIATGVQSVVAVGNQFDDDTVTFCVRASNIYGCPATVTSVPVFFNRVQNVAFYDTACTTITIANKPFGPFAKDSAFVVLDTVPAVDAESCYTIHTHNVMLYAAPQVDFDTVNEYVVDTFYCEPTTVLADIKAAVAATVTPASAEVKILMLSGNQYVDFNETTQLTYTYKDSTFDVMVYNHCDTIFYSEIKNNGDGFKLDLRGVPTIDSFALQALYCPGADTSVTALISNPSSVAVEAHLILGTGNSADTLDTKTVAANADRQPVTFEFTPYWSSFNGKTMTVAVENSCGNDAKNATIAVDTTQTVSLTLNKEYCEGDTMKSADFTINSTNVNTAYTVNTVYVLRKNVTTPATITLPYVVQLADTGMNVYFELTSTCGYPVNTTQVPVTVKPHAKLVVEPWGDQVLCESEAVAAVNVLLHQRIAATDATDSGWVIGYQANALGEQLLLTTALVDSAKKYNEPIYVGYRAVNSNGCGDTTAYVGTLRVLKPVNVTVQPVVVCPTVNGVDFANIYDSIQLHITLDSSNHHSNEVELTYWYKNAGAWSKITDDHQILPTTADTVMVVYQSTLVPDCISDTDYVKVTLYTLTHTEITLNDACEGSKFSVFAPNAPTFNGTAPVTGQYWQVKNQGEQYFHEFTNMDTVFTQNVVVQYVWKTKCIDVLSAPDTINILWNPSVAFNDNVDTIEVCLNATAEMLPYTVTDPSHIVTDTTVTLNGVALDANHVFKMEDNLAKIIVTVYSPCKDTTDTVIVKILDLPEPTAIGDTTICYNRTAFIQVDSITNGSTYVWMFGQDTIAVGPSFNVTFSATNNGVLVTNVDTAISIETSVADLYSFKVVETNAKGCVSETMVNNSNDPFFTDVVTVKVSDGPEFIFTDMNGVKTHEFTSYVDSGLTYVWMVDNKCYDPDELVYVEYDIYYRADENADYFMIPNTQIGQYLFTQTYNEQGTNHPWVTSNTFSWLTNDCHVKTNTAYYNFSVSNPTQAANGNHFPNSFIGLSNTNIYDDFWMHFLAGRPVTKNIVPFRQGGEYKIVYRLYATDNAQDFNHLYKDDCDGQAQHLGGHNALVGNVTLLATDSVHIVVVGANNLVNNTPEFVPTTAPAISADENVVVPEMEVWPNPAPSIVTTFKARVYNMSGDATVTITNFAGKQVYSGSMYIDSDNFYFEADVNSLAVGAYIMSVRTNDAVVTKKLVVTVRK